MSLNPSELSPIQQAPEQNYYIAAQPPESIGGTNVDLTDTSLQKPWNQYSDPSEYEQQEGSNIEPHSSAQPSESESTPPANSDAGGGGNKPPHDIPVPSSPGDGDNNPFDTWEQQFRGNPNEDADRINKIMDRLPLQPTPREIGSRPPIEINPGFTVVSMNDESYRDVLKSSIEHPEDTVVVVFNPGPDSDAEIDSQEACTSVSHISAEQGQSTQEEVEYAMERFEHYLAKGDNTKVVAFGKMPDGLTDTFYTKYGIKRVDQIDVTPGTSVNVKPGQELTASMDDETIFDINQQRPMPSERVSEEAVLYKQIERINLNREFVVGEDPDIECNFTAFSETANDNRTDLNFILGVGDNEIQVPGYIDGPSREIHIGDIPDTSEITGTDIDIPASLIKGVAELGGRVGCDEISLHYDPDLPKDTDDQRIRDRQNQWLDTAQRHGFIFKDHKLVRWVPKR